jgi:hypothetical protein
MERLGYKPVTKSEKAAKAFKLPVPKPERIAMFEKVKRAAIERLAAEAGRNPDELHHEWNGVIEKAVGKAKVFVRMPEEVVNLVLDEGRYKSQFETGNSYGGDVQTEARAHFEHEHMGVPLETPHKLRPVYGYMSEKPPTNRKEAANAHSGTNGYGRVIVELHDRVKDRSTVTFGDSMNSQEETVPSPIRKPTIMSANMALWKPHHQLPVPEVIKLGSVDAAEIDSDYPEAQIYGGLPYSDFAKVWFEKPPKAALQAKLAAKGVVWGMMQ